MKGQELWLMHMFFGSVPFNTIVSYDYSLLTYEIQGLNQHNFYCNLDSNSGLLFFVFTAWANWNWSPLLDSRLCVWWGDFNLACMKNLKIPATMAATIPECLLNTHDSNPVQDDFHALEWRCFCELLVFWHNLALSSFFKLTECEI